MKSLKQVISILVAIAKANSTAVKSRSRVIKAQLTISKLLHNKTEMMSVISQRKRTAKDDELQVNVYNKATVPYGLNYNEVEEHVGQHQFEFEREDVDDPTGDSGSVIDFIKDYEEEGSGLGLENEVDKAAEVFIRRIRAQMRIQKQESFKRYQDMVEKSI